MTSPIVHQQRVSDAIHHHLDLQQPLALDDSAPTAEEHRLSGLHRAEQASLAAEVVGGALELGAHGAAASALSVALAPGAALASSLAEWATAHAEGQHRAHVYEYQRAVGALAFLEGRAPGVRARDTIADRMYGDGYASMAGALRHRPEELAQIRTHIAALRDEGYRAVTQREDRGPAFGARYHADLPFRHAVDHARQLRQRDPAAFESMRDRLASAPEECR